MTRASAAASTLLSTITRCPRPSTISIRLDATTGHDDDGKLSAISRPSESAVGIPVEGSQATTAGENVTASSFTTRRPVRAKRRHAKSWLADSPCRRAVAETSRGALKLSATILCFSSSVQRRRAPVEITSSRETLGIGVWSVIRLCLHLPTHSARRPPPEGYVSRRSRLAADRRRSAAAHAGASARRRASRRRRPHAVELQLAHHVENFGPFHVRGS